MSAPAIGDLAVPALDGLPLRATLIAPPAPAHALIVGSATAVPRQFYRAFAEYFAARNAAVLTYDYRGAGESPAELRRSPARMRDWGELDFPGAIAWMRERYPSLPLYVVGHSYGGQALLLAPNNREVARAVTVATNTGYWRALGRYERYRVWVLLNVVAPLAMRAFGYVPGSKLGLGEDLARGVMDEWRRWCMLPDYFFDDPSMTAALDRARGFDAPVLSIGASDDLWGTPYAIDLIAKHFGNVERTTLRPHDYGLPAIGHFGFFRSTNGPALWPLVTRYLGLVEAAA